MLKFFVKFIKNFFIFLKLRIKIKFFLFRNLVILWLILRYFQFFWTFLFFSYKWFFSNNRPHHLTFFTIFFNNIFLWWWKWYGFIKFSLVEILYFTQNMIGLISHNDSFQNKILRLGLIGSFNIKNILTWILNNFWLLF